MVVFLAHWCPHCNDEIPVLQEWAADGRHPRGPAGRRREHGGQRRAPNYPPDEWLVEKGWDVAGARRRRRAHRRPRLRRDRLPVPRRSSTPTATSPSGSPGSCRSPACRRSPTPRSPRPEAAQRQAAGTSRWSVTVQSAPNTTKRSKPRRNQRSWVTATTVPVNWARPCSSASRRHEVEVVGRLVEQQQRGARPFEQEDLEARLLPARQRVEGLLGAPLQLVAAQHPHRRSAHDVVVVEDVEERAPGPLRVLVGLVEEPGHDAGAEPPRALVSDRRVAGEEAEEVALADAVAAEHGDPLAEPQLEVERVGQARRARRPR